MDIIMRLVLVISIPQPVVMLIILIIELPYDSKPLYAIIENNRRMVDTIEVTLPRKGVCPHL